MKNFLNKVIRLGIGKDTLPINTQYIVITNFVALLGFVLCLYVYPVALLSHFYTAIPVSVGIQLFILLTLYMNYRQWYTLAASYIFLLFLFGTLGQLLNMQIDAGLHYWFLVINITPFLIYPANRTWLAILMSVVGTAIFMWVTQTYVNNYFEFQYSASVLYSQLSVSIGLIGVSLYSRITIQNAQRKVLEAQEQSEQLLLNVLPFSVAERLKQDKNRMIADRYEMVSVIFADIVGFTPLAESMDPEKLVDLLNKIFSSFDDLCEKYGLEKIKTVGDTYMAVAGAPIPVQQHAYAAAELALGMRKELIKFNENTGYQLNIRIGVHSGPAVAGIIGKRKFSYDLWGDVVNIASRMESHGVPGEIQITESTAKLITNSFSIEERGFMDIKGKGQMKTFWLKGQQESA